MIRLKTNQEIETLAEGGHLMAQMLEKLVAATAVGVTGQQLDDMAQQMIAQQHVKAAFLDYGAAADRPGFPAALCVSVNSAVVHGVPDTTPFVDGDVVSLDFGIVYKGMFLDAARTVVVGKGTPEAHELVRATRQSLDLGIAAARANNTVGDIGHAVQSYIEAQGFGVVRELVGHGVGYDVHEDPKVPNYGRAGSGPKLMPGLVIAIEPMVTIGHPAVRTAEDGWTIFTAANGLAAHEEDTIAITIAGPRVLTR